MCPFPAPRIAATPKPPTAAPIAPSPGPPWVADKPMLSSEHVVALPISRISTRRGLARCSRASAGFTLVEMLVVIAVIAVIIAILFPAMRALRGSAASTRELALARQLTTAYLAYATDHRGVLMPGFYDKSPTLPATTEHGVALSPQETHRYPWRLAPYLGFNLDGLYLDPTIRESFAATPQYRYFVSLYPSMGLNTVFVGGDSRPEGLGFNPAFEQIYGRIAVTRLSQARRPSDLIVFGSARTNVPFGPNAPPVIEGYFRLESPYLTSRQWAASWSPELTAKQWGFVSMRNAKASAAIGFLDGRTGLLDEQEIQDMRHWSDRADAPDWTLQPQ